MCFVTRKNYIVSTYCSAHHQLVQFSGSTGGVGSHQLALTHLASTLYSQCNYKELLTDIVLSS